MVVISDHNSKKYQLGAMIALKNDKSKWWKLRTLTTLKNCSYKQR